MEEAGENFPHVSLCLERFRLSFLFPFFLVTPAPSPRSPPPLPSIPTPTPYPSVDVCSILLSLALPPPIELSLPRIRRARLLPSQSLRESVRTSTPLFLLNAT